MRSKNTDLMNEIKKFAEEYYLEYWKSPSTSEIAGAVGVTRATVCCEILRILSKPQITTTV